MSATIFLDLGGVTSSEILVVPAVETSTALRDARRRLHGGSSDRLAELREAATQLRRDLVDDDDPDDEAAERSRVVEAFGDLQAGTAAWNLGD